MCFNLHREGVQWDAIDWMDNAECLDLIEKVSSLLSFCNWIKIKAGGSFCVRGAALVELK